MKTKVCFLFEYMVASSRNWDTHAELSFVFDVNYRNGFYVSRRADSLQLRVCSINKWKWRGEVKQTKLKCIERLKKSEKFQISAEVWSYFRNKKIRSGDRSRRKTLKKYRETLADHFRQLIIPPSVWLRGLLYVFAHRSRIGASKIIQKSLSEWLKYFISQAAGFRVDSHGMERLSPEKCCRAVCARLGYSTSCQSSGKLHSFRISEVQTTHKEV